MKTLTIFTGPTSSEKSTKALLRAQRLQKRGYDLPFVVRPWKSVRKHETPGFLVTKRGDRFPSLEIESALEIYETFRGWGYGWLDEPMLLDDEPSLFDQVQKVRRDIPIMISGCSATSELTPFYSSLPRLIAVADRVRFCRGDCVGCGRMDSATRSICLAVKNDVELVGGEETYRPLCPNCWTKWVNGERSELLFVSGAVAR